MKTTTEVDTEIITALHTEGLAPHAEEFSCLELPPDCEASLSDLAPQKVGRPSPPPADMALIGQFAGLAHTAEFAFDRKGEMT